jgi:hypothetical protein
LKVSERKGTVTRVADGGLSAELVQTFEILGASPGDGHVVPLLKEQFRQRLRYVGRRTRDETNFIATSFSLTLVLSSDLSDLAKPTQFRPRFHRLAPPKRMRKALN